MNLCPFLSFSISICWFYVNMWPWSNSTYFCRLFRLVSVCIFLKEIARIKLTCIANALLPVHVIVRKKCFHSVPACGLQVTWQTIRDDGDYKQQNCGHRNLSLSDDELLSSQVTANHWIVKCSSLCWSKLLLKTLLKGIDNSGGHSNDNF